MKWFDTILFKKRINDDYGGVHNLRGMMKESLSDKNRILLFLFNFPCNITFFFKRLKRYWIWKENEIYHHLWNILDSFHTILKYLFSLQLIHKQYIGVKIVSCIEVCVV